jgi:hypothetical protein
MCEGSRNEGPARREQSRFAQSGNSRRSPMSRRFVIAGAVLYPIVIVPLSWQLFARYGFCYDCTMGQRILNAVLLVINVPLVGVVSIYEIDNIYWLLAMSPLAGALWGWVFWLGWRLLERLRSH